MMDKEFERLAQYAHEDAHDSACAAALIHEARRARTAEVMLRLRVEELELVLKGVFVPFSVREGLTSPAEYARKSEALLERLQARVAHLESELAATMRADGPSTLYDIGPAKEPTNA